MGQQNMTFNCPMLEVEPQQVHHLPEPCMVSYGGVTCFPPPYNVLQPRYLPENHGQLPYMISPYNGEHCNTFMIPVPVYHNHFLFSNHHLFERNRGLFFPNIAGIHGFHVAMNPPNIGPHQLPHNVYPPPPLPPPLPPMPPVQTQNMDIHLQTVSNLHRHFASTYPFMNGVDSGPRYVGPAPPNRHHGFPHFGLLPEEELLVLGEQINVDSSLSDNFISNNLKTKTFILKDSVPADEEPNLCVICQMEFEDEEKIGMLDCCHEYHVECIKKWLIVKNNCPICKSKALT